MEEWLVKLADFGEIDKLNRIIKENALVTFISESLLSTCVKMKKNELVTYGFDNFIIIIERR